MKFIYKKQVYGKKFSWAHKLKTLFIASKFKFNDESLKRIFFDVTQYFFKQLLV